MSFKRRYQWAKIRRVRAHWWLYEVGGRNFFLMELYDPSCYR